MLGFILRRQLLLLTSPRPWLVLVMVVLPAALVLQRLCSTLGGALDLYGWIWRNYADLDPNLLNQLGLGTTRNLWHIAVFAGAAAFQAFVFGFLISRLTRSTIALEALFFLLSLAALEAVFLRLHRRYEYDITQWPFPLPFYTLVLPVLQISLLAILPVFLGMCAGLRARPLHATVRAVLWIGALTAFLSLRWHLTPHGPIFIVLPIRVLILLAAFGPLTLLLASRNRWLASRLHVWSFV